MLCEFNINQGLLSLLKSIQRPCNLAKFAGQTIGVDAYGWLHRGTVACSTDLALGKPTTKYTRSSFSRPSVADFGPGISISPCIGYAC